MSQLGDKFISSAGKTTKKFRIDQNAQKLLIIRTFNPNSWTGLNGRLLNAMPERVSLEIQGLGSTRLSQAERVPLGKMAAYAQFGEGVIAETILSDGTIKQYIPIVLAGVGVQLQAGDNSYLLLENCILTDASYEVYAIQTPTTGNMVYQYLEQSVLGGDKHRKIDVSATRTVVLPVAGLSKLVVYYRGAGTCEYTATELQFLNAEGNDIEVLTSKYSANNLDTQSSVFGSMTSEVIVLKVDAVDQIEVYTDGNLYEYVTIGEIDRDAR
jgi:hypothetical protein